MRRLRSLVVWVSLSALSCASRATQTPHTVATATPVTLRPLTDGVWLHTSVRHVDGMGTVPSHGLVIESREGLLLIDTAWGLDATRELLSQVRARFGRLPSAVIVTHAHDDRVGGLPALREEHIPAYATAATAAIVASHNEGAFDGALSSPIDRRTLAGTEVGVFYPGAAHTPDNIVVWIPSRSVLFGGCMIRPAGARALGNLADADVSAWPESARRVVERYGSARVVVPSHGEPGDATLLTHTEELARTIAASMADAGR